MSLSYGLSSNSLAQTIAIGRRIGQAAEGNDVIALSGPLGAGKTQLAKGIASGLDVGDARTVNSPSFVIVNEYAGRLHMYHVDVYRLAGGSELEALGFDEMCTAGGIVVVEWADRVSTLLPTDHLSVTLVTTGESSRDLRFAAAGPQSEQMLSALMRSQDEATKRAPGAQA